MRIADETITSAAPSAAAGSDRQGRQAGVSLRDVRKRYGSFEAVKGVSLEIDGGGFLGPPAAARTTRCSRTSTCATTSPSGCGCAGSPGASGACVPRRRWSGRGWAATAAARSPSCRAASSSASRWRAPFGWRVLLGTDGAVNSLLVSTGITDAPVKGLMFSRFAVILAQVHLALPFAFIPSYLALERVPQSLLQAASDLYAGGARQFANVELPLISGGVVTGAMFAFGDYIAPQLVGGPGLVTICNVASDQFGASFDWPLGAAVGTIMTVTVIFVMTVPDLARRLVVRVRSSS